MIDAKTFETNVIELLDTLYETQKDNMEAMAETMADCIANGGVVHVFGSGHSVGMGIYMILNHKMYLSLFLTLELMVSLLISLLWQKRMVIK